MSITSENQPKITKRGARSKLPYFILGFILLFGICIYILLVNIIPPLSNVWNYFNRTPAPLPTYASVTVVEMCQLLKISDNDPFCADPKLERWMMSDQNALTLQDMVYRNFPIGQTTFEDILPLLKTLRSQGRLQYLESQELDGSGFKLDGCQLRLEPDGDTCYIVFPGDIRVTIVFGSNGYAIEYHVLGANGEGS